MASHAGLVYVLKTKFGYVNEKGEFVPDLESAKKIDFMQFGFGPSAYQVYKKLGFQNEQLTENDISFYTVVPSYDSRLGIIEDLYRLLGYDYRTSCTIAANEFMRYYLYSYQNFQEYEQTLKQKISSFYEQQEVSDVIGTQKLYSLKEKVYFEPEEGQIECFYSEGKRVYCYSIPLKNPHLENYFGGDQSGIEIQNQGVLEYMKEELSKLEGEIKIYGMKQDQSLKVYLNAPNRVFIQKIGELLRTYYSEHEMHVTRMFGSYILLGKKGENLEAVKATPIPIKYCPLMSKLLKEVGGEYALKLLETLKTDDENTQTQMMCQLINETVIKSGYFDTKRPLNSCEDNVLFGASETMSSAFGEHMIDAAVIVSNNLGTIITTNASNTQGAVKRMTGLFYTSPSEELVKTAKEAGIIPVYPYTATINQLEGVKKAISLGYKRIAVSVAAGDNKLHEALKQLESDEIVIYKFGLCSTGIDEKTASLMAENADVIWTCASKNVGKYVEPNALAQVGIKIPVHIMTLNGYNIVKCHLIKMGFDNQDVVLQKGEEKPVFLNDRGKIKVLQKRMIHHCSDCPHPCV